MCAIAGRGFADDLRRGGNLTLQWSCGTMQVHRIDEAWVSPSLQLWNFCSGSFCVVASPFILQKQHGKIICKYILRFVQGKETPQSSNAALITRRIK